MRVSSQRHADHIVILAVAAIITGCGQNETGVSPPSISQPEDAGSITGNDGRTPAGFEFQTISTLQLPFTFRNGEDLDYYAILESLGGGVASLDFDADGHWDVFLPGGGTLEPNDVMTAAASGLFRNQSAVTFIDCSDVVPAPLAFSHGAASADFDNDGFPDVAITGYGAVQLLRNNGDGTFADATTESQLHDSSWSTTAAWGDLDSDGDLDLYVAHYVDWSFSKNPVCVDRLEDRRDSCPPRSFESLTDEVYLNSGDGKFEASRASLGFGEGGNGLGVIIADLDGDTDVDVYVANDGVPNFMYHNVGGTFEDASIASGADRNDRGLPDGSMGLELGDFNDDLQPDIWVTNYENEPIALYRSQKGGFFQYSSRPMGVAAVASTYVGWGICLSDFDTDGDEDVFIATGHAMRYSASAPRYQKPILLENQNGRFFSNVAGTMDGYFAKDHLGRGVSGCDINNDGRRDLIVSQMHEPSAVQVNTTKPVMDWFGVSLIGRQSSRSPIGATVVLECDGKQQLRIVKGGSSYMSTSDPRLLFAVPTTASSVSCRITWPSGMTQTVSGLSVSEYHRIIEPRESERRQ